MSAGRQKDASVSKKTKHAKHAARHRTSPVSYSSECGADRSHFLTRATDTAQRPPDKTSYEASAEVQRWLRVQTAERAESSRPSPRRFSPINATASGRLLARTLLRGRPDRRRAEMVKSGKEATVYCCAGGSATEREYVAAKVYRPRMFRSLQNDALYRESRAQGIRKGAPCATTGDGARISGRAGTAGAGRHMDQREFQIQRRLYEAGADVPKPFAQIGNALLMDYIGEGDEAAPLLREVSLEREEARSLFGRSCATSSYFWPATASTATSRRTTSSISQGRSRSSTSPRQWTRATTWRSTPAAARCRAVCRYFARYGVGRGRQARQRDMGPLSARRIVRR